MEKLLQMKGVTKTYGGVKALKNVDFDLITGEIHCLVGQNGCGKSTLIKIIAGVVAPDEGSYMEFLGEQAHGGVTAGKGVSVIYQDLSLFPNLTVLENIAVGAHLDPFWKPVDWQKMRQVAQTALDKMQIQFDLDSSVGQLSIADRQLVAIARALATDAKLLIMDEPTSSLSRKEVDILFGIVKDLQAKGMTVLFVSHKSDEILEIAQRITVLRDGVHIGTYPISEMDAAKLAYYISGQNITYTRDLHLPAPDAPVLLETKALSRKNQYEDVSLRLQEGEVLGLIGLLGSGRTELALSLFGMNPPTSGSILIGGKEAAIQSNADAIKHGIAYVSEDRLLQGLVLSQSVESNIAITVLDKLRNVARLLRLPDRRKMTLEWIDRLNIKSATPDINASAMSGGNQQKIVISKWLATNPRVLILDQPTNGIDIAAKSAIYDIILELARSGMGIIIISDEVPEIYYNCTRVLLMNKGKIGRELLTKELTEEELYEAVFKSQ